MGSISPLRRSPTGTIGLERGLIHRYRGGLRPELAFQPTTRNWLAGGQLSPTASHLTG